MKESQKNKTKALLGNFTCRDCINFAGFNGGKKFCTKFKKQSFSGCRCNYKYFKKRDVIEYNSHINNINVYDFLSKEN